MSIIFLVGGAAVLSMIAEFATSDKTRSTIRTARRRAHNAAVLHTNARRRRDAGRIYS